MKCIAVDDEPLALALLQDNIRQVPILELVASCSTGVEVFQIIASQKIDIVFTDIDMPDLNGIDLLKSIKNPPVFVFITSYSDYAVESFNLDVIDFILKPLTSHDHCIT